MDAGVNKEERLASFGWLVVTREKVHILFWGAGAKQLEQNEVLAVIEWELQAAAKVEGTQPSALFEEA